MSAGVVLLVALLLGLDGVHQIGQIAPAFGLALFLAAVLVESVDSVAGRGVPRPWTP